MPSNEYRLSDTVHEPTPTLDTIGLTTEEKKRINTGGTISGVYYDLVQSTKEKKVYIIVYKTKPFTRRLVEHDTVSGQITIGDIKSTKDEQD